jgi:excisionase family DNA binding protein
LPEFWSSKETAEYLGVPLSTLRYWQWQGIGPRSYRIGRSRKYRKPDIDKWAESQADPGADPRREAIK